MSRVVKKATLMLVLCLFTFSLSSCKLLGACNIIMKDLSKVAFKTDPGPYTPFKLMPGERKGIETPQFAWNEMWSDNVMHFIMEGPYISTDETIYWIDQSFHIHQLNRKGDGKWEKKFKGTHIKLTLDGALISRSSMKRGTSFVDVEGKVLWENSHSISNSAFTPQGYLICDSYNTLFSMDAQGKLMWHTYIEEEGYDLFVLKSMFFDEDANGYYVYDAVKSGKKLTGADTYLISLSPEGEIRWSKVLSKYETLLSSFVPTEESLVKDTFLLAFSNASQNEELDGIYTAMNSMTKYIVAYDTMGEELWEIEEYRNGTLDNSYTIDARGRFYYSMNEKGLDEEDYYDMTIGHLLCCSSTGDLLWNWTVKDEYISSSPIIDRDHHLYFTSYQHIFSLKDDGSLRWKWMDDDNAWGIGGPLFFGHQGTIYFYCNVMPFIFCIREKQ